VSEFAVSLLLAAHLLAMNLASAGPLVSMWLIDRRDSGGDARQFATRMVKLSLLGLAVGCLLGGALILVPNPRLRAALARFPADAYWFGAAELVFSGLCMTALLARCVRRRRILACILAGVSALNLLYHFPPLMVVIGELTADPSWTAASHIDRRALLRLWGRPEVLAMWAHFVLASFSAAPIVALGAWPAAAHSQSPRVVRRLGVLALTATALQLPVGLWLLSASTPMVREAFLGGDLTAMLAFSCGVLGALWMLHALVTIALGEDGAAIRQAVILLLVVTLLMTVALRASRARAADGPPHAALADVARSDAYSSFGSFFDSSRSPPGSLPALINSP